MSCAGNSWEGRSLSGRMPDKAKREVICENGFRRINWEGRCSAARFAAASKCERTSDNVLREVKVKDKKCD